MKIVRLSVRTSLLGLYNQEPKRTILVPNLNHVRMELAVQRLQAIAIMVRSIAALMGRALTMFAGPIAMRKQNVAGTPRSLVRNVH
jgi:hypothetical protein